MERYSYQQLDELLMALRRAIDNLSVAIFVDPTLGDPLQFDDELRVHVEAAQQQQRVQRIKLPFIHHNFDPERHPYVLYVPNEERAERLVATTLRIALEESLALNEERRTARALCGWIIDTHNDAPSLVKRLSSVARIVKPDGLAWYLRYWDPRVMWQLPRVLDPTHWRQIQQSWGTWCSVGSDLTLARFSADAAPTAADKPLDDVELICQLSSSQWRRLQRVGTINKVLPMTYEWGMKPDAAAALQIERLLLAAEKLGFSAERDSLLFATCGLTSHLRFYEHPQVAHALKQARDAIMTLSDVLQPFDDEFWTQLKTWSPTEGRSLPRSE